MQVAGVGTSKRRPLEWIPVRVGRWSGHLYEEVAGVGTLKRRSLEWTPVRGGRWSGHL
jgi:hypothetical protein